MALPGMVGYGFFFCFGAGVQFSGRLEMERGELGAEFVGGFRGRCEVGGGRFGQWIGGVAGQRNGEPVPYGIVVVLRDTGSGMGAWIGGMGEATGDQ